MIPNAPATTDTQPLDDAHMAERIADDALAGRYLWAAGLGWQKYDGRRWERASDASVAETVRKAVIDFHAGEAHAGADVDRLRKISSLFSANRIRAIVTLARGICEVDADQFDGHPDLLNVGNGVVDLRTGELGPHDPGLLFTRVTPIKYRADARHPDWGTALEALPAEDAAWMHQRIGQAATGHPTPDDVLPVLQGGGANGKSTWLASIMRALGDYAVAVPERVLLADPRDHPTELMQLRGARLAVIEETPEARHLSVKRLKDTLGTDPMSARYIAKDTVSWHPTHSLVLASNYVPRIDEVDHGTWRRLALVRFPYTYRVPGKPLLGSWDRHGDPTLRDRLKSGREGQLEAILAWIVAGARRWYEAGQILPPAPDRIAADTRRWRTDSDLILGFVDDHLIVDRDRWVLSAELFTTFNEWLTARGHRPWSDQTFAARFGQHDEIAQSGIEYRRTLATTAGISRPPGHLNEHAAGGRPRTWHGIRYRTPADDHDEPTPAEKPQVDQGDRGTAEVLTRDETLKPPNNPGHPGHETPESGNCRVCSQPILLPDGTGICARRDHDHETARDAR